MKAELGTEPRFGQNLSHMCFLPSRPWWAEVGNGTGRLAGSQGDLTFHIAPTFAKEQKLSIPTAWET